MNKCNCHKLEELGYPFFSIVHTEKCVIYESIVNSLKKPSEGKFNDKAS